MIFDNKKGRSNKPNVEIFLDGDFSRTILESKIAKELFQDVKRAKIKEFDHLSLFGHAHDMVEKWQNTESHSLVIETPTRMLTYNRK